MVAQYNADPDVHGILVQLPLPAHINEQRILDAISINKDVDGFHPANIGALAMRGRTPLFVSCTPKARRDVRVPCLLYLDSRRVQSKMQRGRRDAWSCWSAAACRSVANMPW